MLIAGVDEAGRGPLAGPVTAAAVILPADHGIHGLDDSKRLSEKQRESLFDDIQATALAFSIVHVSAQRVDEINILQATMSAMAQALHELHPGGDIALIDGNRAPAVNMPVVPLVKGDGLCPVIAAASILAKVSRDRHMLKLCEKYPVYGFSRHKGYGTKVHMQALNEHGPCPEHRRSFAPVRKALRAVD